MVASPSAATRLVCCCKLGLRLHGHEANRELSHRVSALGQGVQDLLRYGPSRSNNATGKEGWKADSNGD